jgi:hypothetical protein
MQLKCKHSTKKKQRPPRECPAFGESQRDDILRMLLQAAPACVSRSFLIFESKELV